MGWVSVVETLKWVEMESDANYVLVLFINSVRPLIRLIR